MAASFWVRDNGPAQGSLAVAIVFVLLHVSIIAVLLIAVWLKRRAGGRSAQPGDRDSGSSGIRGHAEDSRLRISLPRIARRSFSVRPPQMP